MRASDGQIDSLPPGEIDYNAVIPFKHRLLETAWANFKAGVHVLTFEQPMSNFEMNRRIGWRTTHSSGRLKVKFGDAYYLDWPAELVQRKACGA